MSYLISNAMAASSQAAGPQSESAFSLIMIIAIFVVFYFMLIRPQNKRAKEHRELINNLKKGDEIVTSGGILAKVVHLNDQFIKISVAEGIEMNLQKGAVSAVLPKGTIKTL